MAHQQINPPASLRG